jgi:uncharacterized protein YjiK
VTRRRLQVAGGLAVATVALGGAAYLTLEGGDLLASAAEPDRQDCDLPAASGRLNQATLTPLPALKGLDSVSGIAYWPEASSPGRKVFLVVDDHREEALFRVILSQDGGAARVEVESEPLDKQLHNPEGITYLGQNRFAVVEERRQRALVLELSPEAHGGRTRCLTEPLDGGRFRELCRENQQRGGPLFHICNSGLEGISFDGGSRLYFAQEKHPKRLIYVEAAPLLRCAPEGGEPARDISFPEIIEPTWVSRAREIADLSDLVVLPGERLMLLSQECEAVVEFELDGKPRSVLALPHPELAQVEGITWDGADHLYLAGEAQKPQRASPFYELTLPPAR